MRRPSSDTAPLPSFAACSMLGVAPCDVHSRQCRTPSAASLAISTLPAPSASAANDLDVSHWMDECFKDAQQTVYKTPIGAGAGPFTLTPAYKTEALKLAQKRIAIAGARLAKILNEELR